MNCSFLSSCKNTAYLNLNDYATAEEVVQRALEFDFNKYKKPYEKTFELKLMEMVTNELGNSILPCVAEVIILQFRKFMGSLAYSSIYSK